MIITKKLVTGIATASLFAATLAPAAFADTGTDVAGNGAYSDNNVKVTDNQQTKVDQTNKTDITNTVNTNQNTGNNHADFNTGGSVKIVTGDANSNVNINNQAGENQAKVVGGGSNNSYADVAGNGAFSQNRVNLSNNDQTKVDQTNNTRISNDVYTHQNTGNNTASYNTGTDVVIATGNANSSTNINNEAGRNFATVYNGKSSNDSYVDVAGNGAFSDNKVSVSNKDKTDVSQTNNTRFYNDVKTYQNTGNNSASFNTGGKVYISTGDANSNVGINNQAGQNFATVYNDGKKYNRYDGTNVDVYGNGAFSENKVRVTNDTYDKIHQNNYTNVKNDVKTYQNTGKNYADFNTSVKYPEKFYKEGLNYKPHEDYGKYKGGQVTIKTGDTNSNVHLNNQAGYNSARVY